MYPNFNYPLFPSQFGGMPNTMPNMPQVSPAAPVSLIKVSGIEGAKAYQMPPNSCVPLFHESENVLFVKTTDGAGFPTIRTFKFEEVTGSIPTTEPTYITREEFDAFKKEIADAQRTV